MRIQEIEEILLDQKQLEVDDFNPADYCTRPEEAHLNLSSNLAQVVIGVRRCGKSTLCMNVLKKSGLRFAYVNFDDERLAKLTGEELNSLLIALYKVYGPRFLKSGLFPQMAIPLSADTSPRLWKR